MKSRVTGINRSGLSEAVKRSPQPYDGLCRIISDGSLPAIRCSRCPSPFQSGLKTVSIRQPEAADGGAWARSLEFSHFGRIDATFKSNVQTMEGSSNLDHGWMARRTSSNTAGIVPDKDAISREF